MRHYSQGIIKRISLLVEEKVKECPGIIEQKVRKALFKYFKLMGSELADDSELDQWLAERGITSEQFTFICNFDHVKKTVVASPWIDDSFDVFFGRNPFREAMYDECIVEIPKAEILYIKSDGYVYCMDEVPKIVTVELDSAASILRLAGVEEESIAEWVRSSAVEAQTIFDNRQPAK